MVNAILHGYEMIYVDLVGWVASGFTLAAYSMRTMLPLRVAAIGANLTFASYGWLVDILPMLVLHVVLLPFNIYHLVQILRTGRDIKAARTAGAKLDAIRPLMRRLTLPDGATLFRKGDSPDNLYILDNGLIRLVEIDSMVVPGEMFGEIAFFSEARERTLTAIREGDCVLLALNERDFITEFYRNPAFCFAMIKLVTQRVVQRVAPVADGGARAGAG